MKYGLFFPKGKVALILITFMLPLVVRAQEGAYTVRIKDPVRDTVYACPGSLNAITFRAEGNNNDPGLAFDPDQVTFIWYFGYNRDSAVGPSVTYAYKEGGHYLVKLLVKGKSGKPDALNVPEKHIYLGVKPSFVGTRSDQASLCSGNPVGLVGFAKPVPWTKDTFPFVNTFREADYIWSGLGVVEGSNSNGIATTKPPLDKGNINYIFRVRDNFGCYSDTTLTLYGVYASFTVNPRSGEAPLEIKMEIDSSSNGGFESSMNDFTWKFREINNPDTAFTLLDSTKAPTFTLERPGEYLCRMVTRYEQCRYVYTSEDLIRVDSSLLEIPNVFTPNGDGANDYFQVKALSLKTFSGVIMNRWGKVVYEWTDPRTLESGWNGKYMNTGQESPDGTYFYVILATGYDDRSYPGAEKVNKKKYTGFLTLIR